MLTWVTSPDQLTAIMQNLITVRTKVFREQLDLHPEFQLGE